MQKPGRIPEQQEKNIQTCLNNKTAERYGYVVLCKNKGSCDNKQDYGYRNFCVQRKKPIVEGKR